MTNLVSSHMNLSQDELKKRYWGLGSENKWMECIDGRHHHLGKTVFDEGLHGKNVEPGFIGSMEKTFAFIQDHLQTKISADWYLQLHKQTCAHFDGKKTNTLMGQEGVGVFRDSHDMIGWHAQPPYYFVTPEARAEFEALDLELKKEFGESYGLGKIIFISDQLPVKFKYQRMSQEQIRRVFDKFVNDLYREIDHATNADERLWAIAGLQQRLEWLHPVKDGTARTNTAMMNKSLTQYVSHPAILEYPHVSSCYSRAKWMQYLKESLLNWEQRREKLNLGASEEKTAV